MNCQAPKDLNLASGMVVNEIEMILLYTGCEQFFKCFVRA